MPLSLRELAVPQQQGRQRVLRRQLLEDVLGGALLAAGRLLRAIGSFSSSKSTWRSCGGELMLNGRPASW